MKRIVVVLLILMLTVLCGCQKTPDAPIVNSGKQEDILEKVEPAAPAQTAAAKSDWSTEKQYDSGNTLAVDAMVYPGDSAEVPVYRVSARPFESGESLKALCGALYPGYRFFEPQGKYTAEEILTQLNGWKQTLYYAELNGDTDSVRDINAMIDELNENLKNVVPESELPDTDFTLKKYEDSSQLNIKGTKDGAPAISVAFANFTDHAICSASLHVDVTHTVPRISDDVGFSDVRNFRDNAAYQDAKSVGDAYLETLGATDMTVASVRNSPEEAETYFELNYRRTLNGRHECDAPTFLSDHKQVEDHTYAPKWGAESLTLRIDDGEIIAVRWGDRANVEVYEQNAKILSFDEAQQIFADTMDLKLTPACVFETPYHVAIDRAELCYLKIARKDSDEYLLVPAWCFFGTDAEYAPTETLVLAVNAIDGTIIDGGYGE